MNKPTRYKVVYEQILEKILTSAVKSDDPLSEEALAAELNVSRTPIREAFKRLENEKLIDIIPYRGTFVRQITLNDINEIFLIRELLESVSAKIACEKIDKHNLTKLEEELDRAEELFLKGCKKESAKTGNIIHDVILRIAGNERIQQVVSNMHLQTTRLKRIASTVPGRLEKSNMEHRKLMDALKKKDPELAEQCMREHIRNTKQDLVNAYINHDIL